MGSNWAIGIGIKKVIVPKKAIGIKKAIGYN